MQRSLCLRKCIFRCLGIARACRFGYREPAPDACISVAAAASEDAGFVTQQQIRNSIASNCHERLVVPEHTPPLPLMNQPPLPELFCLKLREASVFANGVIITRDNRILKDVSPDLGTPPDWHRVCAAGRLPEAKRMSGNLAVLSSLAFAGNYYHWLFDTLARMSFLPYDFQGRYLIEHDRRYQQEYLALAGLNVSDLVQPTADSHWLPETLVVPSMPGDSGVIPPESIAFLQALRDRALSGPGPASTTPRRLFLARTGSIARRIANETDLLRLLQEHGFVLIDAGTLPVREQIRLLHGAEVVVAPHGAALANLVYCRPDTLVVELFSEKYVNWCYRGLCARANLQYACLICRSPWFEGWHPAMTSDLEVSLEALAALLPPAT